MKKITIFGLERNPFNDLLFDTLAKTYFDLYVIYTCSSKGVTNNTFWEYKEPVTYKIKKLFGINRWKIFYEIFVNRDSVLIFTGYRSIYFIFAMILSYIFGVKYLVFTDTLFINRKIDFLKLLVRNFARHMAFIKSDGILTTGGPGREALINYGCDPSKIINFPYVSSAPNFLKFSKIPLKNEKEILTKTFRKTVIFFSGQLIYRKGVDTLIFALSLIKDKKIPFYCFIEGDGPLKNHLLELIRNLKLTDSVSIIGFNQTAVHSRYLAISDIVVSPSRYEPWGNIVHEAMLLGKVVISSNQVKSAIDRIINGVNGFIYTVDNVSELQEKLELAILDIKFRKVLGVKAKKTASSWKPEINAINLASYLAK